MAEDTVTTQELLEFLQENMLTKEDGKKFATKEDGKNFATKEDIEQIRLEMATKGELREMEARIMERFSAMDREIEDIKKALNRLETKT
ncbi:hypothetical protein KJ641_02685 [Patescibacteria group bacterium]|nr:hypothetical protein [Patescibacteria group bacterium]MBU1895751.1 hypothetical protein [Patescibacteria group bacterium]